MIWKLAWQNLIGAGLRTWLNIIVLSFSFVVIVWHKGLLEGWNQQAKRDTIEWEIGGGQIWHENYDPYDAFTLSESMALPDTPMRMALSDGSITPVLICQATIYPEGRMRNVMFKGLDPHQTLLKIPSKTLLAESSNGSIPVIIGQRMADSIGAGKGDQFTARWRDKSGAFDATSLYVQDIFKTNVPTVDAGTIWLPIESLRDMLAAPSQATLWVVKSGFEMERTSPWVVKDHRFLLAQFDQMIAQKKIGGIFLYAMMLGLALLALFDTQVLSVFRRQREVGTLMALGMTRGQVIGLFTLEGTLTAILAGLFAAVYGIPLLGYLAIYGIPMPEVGDAYGMVVGDSIFPVYSLGLILTSTSFILVAATLVSYIPVHKITRMKPTDAIRGKLQ